MDIEQRLTNEQTQERRKRALQLASIVDSLTAEELEDLWRNDMSIVDWLHEPIFIDGNHWPSRKTKSLLTEYDSGAVELSYFNQLRRESE